MILTHLCLFQFLGGASAAGTPPPPVVVGKPIVGNNDFWKKGYRQIGQTRRWRYWWEKDPTLIPAEIPVAEEVEEIQAEANAVSSYITDLVIERAAEETLKIMRAYYDLLQEQIAIRQQKARVEAGIVSARVAKEQRIIKRKKMMLLLS